MFMTNVLVTFSYTFLVKKQNFYDIINFCHKCHVTCDTLSHLLNFVTM